MLAGLSWAWSPSPPVNLRGLSLVRGPGRASRDGALKGSPGMTTLVSRLPIPMDTYGMYIASIRSARASRSSSNSDP
jgi:hypothetical protein